jgi:hypothetical protein
VELLDELGNEVGMHEVVLEGIEDQPLEDAAPDASPHRSARCNGKRKPS